MIWHELLAPFAVLDGLALVLLGIAWLGSDWLIEHPPAGRLSVSILMADLRREWMREFVTREARIFDATIIDSLRQGTAFFASACIIAIGAGAALVGNPAPLEQVASDLSPLPVADGMALRVILVLLFMADALLKFIWAHRLFGYCSILMAAVPNDADHPEAHHRAAMAAEVNITAARSFNRGLRSVYFALAALAWLAGAVPLMLATLASTYVLLRREFASESRRIVLQR